MDTGEVHVRQLPADETAKSAAPEAIPADQPTQPDDHPAAPDSVTSESINSDSATPQLAIPDSTTPQPAAPQVAQADRNKPQTQSPVYTLPATESLSRNPPNRTVLAGTGRFELYRQGDITWRMDTASGKACVLFATEAMWRKPLVYDHGCGNS
jgi:hypothetical protein